MDKKFLWVSLACLAVVLVGTVVALLVRQPAETFNGSVIDPPTAAPELALSDQNGQPFSLESYKGRVVLIFFGFTHCTDECPKTLALLHQMRTDLGAQADAVQVVLVTTDPANDTPKQLETYLSAFDPTFLGLTGPEENLQAAYAAYGVTVLEGGETHSTYTYVIDGQGKMRLVLPYTLTGDQILHDVRQIVQEQSKG
jgi:protein SCO1/2